MRPSCWKCWCWCRRGIRRGWRTRAAAACWTGTGWPSSWSTCCRYSWARWGPGSWRAGSGLAAPPSATASPAAPGSWCRAGIRRRRGSTTRGCWWRRRQSSCSTGRPRCGRCCGATPKRPAETNRPFFTYGATGGEATGFPGEYLPHWVCRRCMSRESKCR